jgi:hypothetical protein
MIDEAITNFVMDHESNEQEALRMAVDRQRKRDSLVAEFGVRTVTARDLSSGSVIVASNHLRIVHSVKLNSQGKYGVKQETDRGNVLFGFYDENEVYEVLDKLHVDRAVELVRA